MKRSLLVLVALAALATAVPATADAAASPAGLTGIALDGAVDLSWQPVVGATAYNVYRGTTPTTVTTLISPVGGVAATGFTDTGAVDSTTYYYAVKPIVAGSESGSSLTVQATPRVRTCSTGNPVVVENCYPGDNTWQASFNAPAPAAGGIDAFATATSVNKTGSITLKVNSASSTYRVEIYRMGYYGAVGGRLFSTILGVPATAQPACTSNATTGLYDCSNWAASLTITTTASWASGVYMIRLVRTDTGWDTNVLVAVRDDSRVSDILYGVPFTTYEAYNNYGGKSLYSFNSTGATTVSGTTRAVKVSFDRPFAEVSDANRPDWFPRADYPLVSWLEQSGYDVTYGSVTDLETSGVGNHKVYIAAPHDEYTSGNMRSAVEAARAAGTNLFFSGANADYWKIRFENGPNGGVSRVEVCYKTVEGSGSPPDPVSPTTTWRDPAGPNNPENALIGQMYVGDGPTYYPLVVNAAEGKDRIWRYTALGQQAVGASTSIGIGLVGWEWDKRDTTNGFEPSRVKSLATTQATGNISQNFGQTTAPGTTPTNVTKYVAASGALVFSTGSMYWSRGLALDGDGKGSPDLRIQQATTNVLEDMKTAPATPAANLTLDSAGAPTVTSTSPLDASTQVSRTTTVTATFSRAMNASTITSSSFTLVKPDGTAVAATVAYNGATNTATLTPTATLDYSVTYSAQLVATITASDGTALQAPYNWIFTTVAAQQAVRVNAGGAAYTAGDGRVFSADQYFSGGFTNSTTATITGTTDPKLYQDERWGQFSYAIPVVNGTYDVKLHFVEMYYTAGSCVGKRIFSIDILDTTTSPDVSNLDVCAQAGGANKALVVTVFGVNVTDGFVNLKSVYGSIDDPEIAAIEVVPSAGPPPPPTVTAVTPADGSTGVGTAVAPTATFSRAMDSSTITSSSFTLTGPSGAVAASVAYNSTTNVATLTPNAALASSTTYTAKLATTIKASEGTPLASAFTWAFTTSAPVPPGAVRINAGGGAYTTGDGRVFSADQYFTGGSTNSTTSAITGTTDQKLFQDERWGNFSYAIPVANGTYDVKLYFVEMFYVSGSCIGKRVFSVDIGDTPTNPDIPNLDVCAAAGGANKALIKTISGVQVSDGTLNIQAVYGSVDDPEIAAIEVVPSTPSGPPTVTSTSPASGATNVDIGSKVTATFSRAMDATTITGSSFTLTGPSGAVAASVAYDSASNTATLTPSSALALSSTYTANLTTAIKASDGTPLASPVTWSFTTSSSVQQPSTVRINSGGGAYTTGDGRAFTADQYFTGGSTNSTTATITGTSDPSLYQNERWGSFSYAIPVVNGTYDVTFHFVEIFYTSGSCVGKRLFSMDIGDTAANPDIQNLDICAEAGGANKALVKTISGVQVTDGVLNIQSVYGSVDDPELAAIEVTPSTSPPQPPPTPDQVGQWSTPETWPLVTVHASLLPTGNVLVWDGFAAAPNSQRVWNPSSDAFTPVPYAVNVFCAGHIILPDGRVLVAGGHQSADVGIPDTSIYDPATGKWSAAQSMTVGRWYPTVTELGDGRALVFAGDNIVTGQTGVAHAFRDSSVNSLPEVFDPTKGTWTDLTASKLTSPLYPYMFQLSDGRILDAGPDTTTRILNPSTWAWSTLGTSPFDGMSAVMYRPDKIMKAGAWADPDFAGSLAYASSAQTAVLDMTAPSPAWRTTAPMKYARSYENLTLLPDGSVLTSGGENSSDGVDTTQAVYPAEIWNPDTELWTTVASLAIPRLYHSTALLLPDGRVLMAGGGQLPGSSAVNETNAEIYSPPYLFKGARPTISGAPSLVQYGQSFQVQTPDAAGINKVSLVRLPSVTHAFDQNQRFQFLSFTAGSGVLNVTAPSNANSTPPGYYMLFILNGSGVPSKAAMIRFPAPWEDAQPPTAPTGLTATGAIGQASLSWTPATDNVGVTAYDVYRSTTSGFTPSAANRIAHLGNVTSYTDTVAAGTYYYVVEAEDAAGNLGPPSNQASATVTSDTAPPTVSITAPAPGVTVSGITNVTADASDNVGVVGVQFKLDGNNLGLEDMTSPYSVSWDTSTATNGSHSLTAVARDAASNSATSSTVTVTVSNGAPVGLVAAYNFDAGTGTTLADRSGTGNNGTIASGTWSTTGHTVGALSFNGTSTLVTIPDSSSLDLTTGMTLEAWVKPSAFGTTWRAVLFKEQTNDMVYSLYANQGGSKALGQVFANGIENNTTGTSTLSTTAWWHLAATFDGQNLRLYVNGALESTVAVLGAMPISTGVLHMGGDSVWGERFAGLMDDVRIYNRALTQAQIQTDMNTAVQ